MQTGTAAARAMHLLLPLLPPPVPPGIVVPPVAQSAPGQL
jgi:hypothetical protein